MLLGKGALCQAKPCSDTFHALCECPAKLKQVNSYSAAMETVKSSRGGQCCLWEGKTNSRRDIREERNRASSYKGMYLANVSDDKR